MQSFAVWLPPSDSEALHPLPALISAVTGQWRLLVRRHNSGASTILLLLHYTHSRTLGKVRRREEEARRHGTESASCGRRVLRPMKQLRGGGGGGESPDECGGLQ